MKVARCVLVGALALGCTPGRVDPGPGHGGAGGGGAGHGGSGGTGSQAGASGGGGAGGEPGEPDARAPTDDDAAAPDATTTEDAPLPVADASDARLESGGFDSSAADPGTDGDGLRTLPGPYKAAPELTRQAGVPQGKLVRFTMDAASAIYPKAPTTRKIAVYVPAQYKPGTPAPVIVVQDGTDFYGFDTSFPPAFDNLIAKGAIPPLVAVFAGNGGGDYIGSERGLEYDTVSGLYAAWVDRELFPRVEAETKAQLPAQAVTLTKDPEGRAALGGSSGGAASFSMAWWHPDLFRRVITFSGTYVDQVPATSPFPHGCWAYHDLDPYDASGPNGLVVAHCEDAARPAAGSDDPGACDTPLTRAACEAVAGCAWNTTVNKPLRVWLESGSNDNGATASPSGHRNFDLASQRLAAALQRRGYHVHHDHALGAGHVDQGPIRQTLPEALTWLWRGYVPAPAR